MRYYFLVFFIFKTLELYPQCSDTIVCTPGMNKMLWANLSRNKTQYFVDDVPVSLANYKRIQLIHDSVVNYIETKSKLGCYFIILDEDSLKYEEGYLFSECSKGPYKEYYKNGRLKEDGCYSGTICNKKVGIWNYYDIDGKILKREEYDR